MSGICYLNAQRENSETPREVKEKGEKKEEKKVTCTGCAAALLKTSYLACLHFGKTGLGEFLHWCLRASLESGVVCVFI